MSDAPLLDTHIWLWWLLGDPSLSKSERDALDALPADDRPFLCDISLWEAALLVANGRLELDMDLQDFLETATSPATVQLVRITPSIVLEMNRLPDTFHRDPADRLILSTARAQGLTLATKDARIRKSRLARIWKI